MISISFSYAIFHSLLLGHTRYILMYINYSMLIEPSSQLLLLNNRFDICFIHTPSLSLAYMN